MFNCSHTNSQKWHIESGKGLLTKDQSFNTIQILSDKELILFGTEETPETFKRAQETGNFMNTSMAIICRSEDGGMSWTKQTFETGGYWQVCKTGNKIFASKIKNNGPLMPSSSVIYLSTNRGLSWKIVKEVPYIIISMNLNESGKGILYGRPGESRKYDNKFFQATDSLNNITEIKTVCPLREFYIYENFIIGYSTNNDTNENNLNDHLSIFDYKSNKCVNELIDKKFDGALIYQSENTCWLVGNTGENISLYVRKKANSYQCVSTIESKGYVYFAKHFYAHNDYLILVIGSRVSNSIKNLVFYSKDGGKQWHEERLVKEDYIDPIAFCFDSIKKTIRSVAYSGSGKIQIRD